MLDSAVCRQPPTPYVSTISISSTANALDGVEVILTGWGAPRLDRRRLDLLPRLSSVIHCAGSVKSVVTPHLWQRNIAATGLRVDGSSGVWTCSTVDAALMAPAVPT